MSNTETVQSMNKQESGDEPIDRAECYRTFRRDGFGIIRSVCLGQLMYSMSQAMDKELEHPDEWRENEE